MTRTSMPSSLARNLRSIVVASCAAGCGGNHDTIDAMPDMAPVTLDCTAYCAEIQKNCTGENAQYLDAAHCMATCASFAVGTSTVTDASGNTLGCRINYAVAAATMPATHCAHAGPAGDLLTATSPAFCSGGNVCTSFCTLEIKSCGSSDVPLPDNPLDATNNPLWQYKNMGDCMQSCGGVSGSPGYDKTRPYTTTSTGDSLACRLLQATSAAIAVTPNAKMSCANTAEFARGPCAGTASP